MEDPKNFALQHKLEYSLKGEFETTGTIIMMPPSMETYDESEKLSQLVVQTLADVGKKYGGGDDKDTPKKEQEDLDVEAVRGILYLGNVSIIEISKSFTALALKTCKVDENIYLTRGIIKKMHIDDFKNLMCEYIVSFLGQSL